MELYANGYDERRQFNVYTKCRYHGEPERHGNGLHNIRCYFYQCNSESETNGRSELTKYLFRSVSELNSERCGRLQLDRRLNSDSESSNTSIDNDDDLYGNGYNE